MKLDDLNSLAPADFIDRLGAIFEHAPWVAEGALPKRPFSTVRGLYEAMCATVDAASDDVRLALLKGHPELAGRQARAGEMAEHSITEQAGAGLDRLTDDEFAQFEGMNALYMERFGLPYIVCVKRHGRASLLRNFAARLESDPATERRTAETEVKRIAAIRLDALVEGEGSLGTTGRISTHVLDTVSGRPAAGVEVELLEFVGDERTAIVLRTVTNADGRTDVPLIGGRPVPIASYELRFSLGAYHRAGGLVSADPAFLEIVPIRFSVGEPEAHYHVPLVATPWSYQTYRGS